MTKKKDKARKELLDVLEARPEPAAKPEEQASQPEVQDEQPEVQDEQPEVFTQVEDKRGQTAVKLGHILSKRRNNVRKYIPYNLKH